MVIRCFYGSGLMMASPLNPSHSGPSSVVISVHIPEDGSQASSEEDLRSQVVQAIKEIHSAGPSWTLLDMLDSPYRRKLPRGKTLHVVEHQVDLGDRSIAPCCSWQEVSRVEGAPSSVCSRILFPASPSARPIPPWRPLRRAFIWDGFDHPAIRARADRILEQLESGVHLPQAPLGRRVVRRVGDRSSEIRLDRWNRIPAQLGVPTHPLTSRRKCRNACSSLSPPRLTYFSTWAS